MYNLHKVLKLKCLFCERHSQDNEKIRHGVGENICKRHLARTVIKVYKDFFKVNNKKISNPITNVPKTLTDSLPNKMYA